MWWLSAALGRELGVGGGAGSQGCCGGGTRDGGGYVDLEITHVCSLHPR